MDSGGGQGVGSFNRGNNGGFPGAFMGGKGGGQFQGGFHEMAMGRSQHGTTLCRVIKWLWEVVNL